MSKKKFTFGEITERAKEQMRDDDAWAKEHIVRHPELENLIPALTAEEFGQLEANLRAEGCRDPLVLWKQGDDYLLIDGHNRHRICTQHSTELITRFGYDFKFVLREFADMQEAKDWMINNQLGKRNLTEEWKSYLRGVQYRTEKMSTGRPKKDSATEGLKTAERLAELHKVSDKTIRRDEKFVDVLDKITGNNEQLRKDILNRVVRLPKMELLSLEGEDERVLHRIGELLTEGTPFLKAMGAARAMYKPAEEVAAYSPSEQVQQVKAQLLAHIEKAVAKGDTKPLYKAADLLKQLEALLAAPETSE